MSHTQTPQDTKKNTRGFGKNKIKKTEHQNAIATELKDYCNSSLQPMVAIYGVKEGTPCPL